MLSVIFIGIVSTVGLFAALAKTSARTPKKAEKSERAEIIKQLLALSDDQNKSSVITAAPGTGACSESAPGTCSDISRKQTPTKRNSKRKNRKGKLHPLNSAKPNQTETQIEEKIRQRAYELYQARGGLDGNSTDDWLRAKQEVLSGKAR